jgi:hypothetical protein
MRQESGCFLVLYLPDFVARNFVADFAAVAAKAAAEVSAA